jgi:hypothetical protein
MFFWSFLFKKTLQKTSEVYIFCVNVFRYILIHNILFDNIEWIGDFKSYTESPPRNPI